ncbi:hypothetical protein K6Q96_03780 [Grimontia kaedaensis]|uniref:Uncharacterized protein n=1 Tax=Grimontia kaedaensis TaxID=2872157 RepID=A0ABY4WU69_9GAMM|nr:hypothetical protein [Grimontia kaedaensis]USH03144.1 hypothetical protein K6Q96_03780 [Grimontia kaedaensis]
MQTKSAKLRAQWALTFVWWVVFVCLSQNAGLFNVCPQKNLNASELSQESTQIKDSAAAGDCELTEQLLSSSKIGWEDITLSLFVWVLLFFGFLPLIRLKTDAQTEPIHSPYRLHLKLCVFRE